MQQLIYRMPRRGTQPQKAAPKRRVGPAFAALSALYVAALWLLFCAGEGAFCRWMEGLAATWGEGSALGGLLAGAPAILGALALGGYLLFSLLVLAGHPCAHRWLLGVGAALCLLGGCALLPFGAGGGRALFLPLVQSGVLLCFLGSYAHIARKKSRRAARGR